MACSKSSLKLGKERKYAIELVSVKIYSVIFLVAKAGEDITNHFLKPAKVLWQ